MNHTFLIQPDTTPDGQAGFCALCPELGVASQGDTEDEARANLQEAVDLFLDDSPDGKTATSEGFTTPRASVRLNGALQSEMALYISRATGATKRVNYSGAARAFLDDAVRVLQAGRTEFQRLFTLNEWRALADCFNGTLLEPSIWPDLHHEWREAETDDDLADKWSVDGVSVYERLRTLSPAARWAFCDVLGRVKVDVTTESLRAAGARIAEDAHHGKGA